VGVAVEDRVVHEHDHVVGFYDTDDDLVAAVAAFLAEGLTDQGAAIVIATAAHRAALERALAVKGLATDILARVGRYQSFDAGETLAAFMHEGRPDPKVFSATIGRLIRNAARDGVPVRIFGEMVALLWDEGNVAAAVDLESLWNDLADEHRFTLYCAYPSKTLSAPNDLAAIKQVCDHHASVLSLSYCDDARSGLSTDTENDLFVLGFVPTPTVLRAVRRFVADVLRGWGADQLVGVSQIIACELATNAMMHARSPFRLAITRTATAIEIAVRDASTLRPETRPIDPGRAGGRGLVLVDRIADKWGSRDEVDGKTVWAVLAHRFS
jgi:anti-sigma regulatory factor (Ser/Thr protein kinase)